jgi:hypothetical protein
VTTHQFAKAFIKELKTLKFENAFNPYTETCPHSDVKNAPKIRCQNLEIVLNAAVTQGVDSIWIARDLGYRGGRRTGLALTDEIHLSNQANLFNIPKLYRATSGPVISERTANVIWQALQLIDRPIFLWNIFPLHPHEPGKPMSNRCHTRSERNACKHILLWLVEALAPRSVISIGRDAQASLDDFCVESDSVRHPSYGGQTDFMKGLAFHYNFPLELKPHQMQLF